MTIDDGVIYTGSADGSARSWNIRTWKVQYGECKAIFRGHTGTIIDVLAVKHNENKFFFTCSADGTVRTWDTNTGSCKKILNSMINQVNLSLGFIYCPTGDSEDNIVVLFPTLTSMLSSSSSGGTANTTASTSTDSYQTSTTSVASTNTSSFSIQAWNLKTGSGKLVQTFSGHRAPITLLKVYTVMVTRGSFKQFVFSASADLSVRQWDFKQGTCLRMFRGAHAEPVVALAMTSSMDDNHLYSSASDNTLIQWNYHQGEGSTQVTRRIRRSSTVGPMPPSRPALLKLLTKPGSKHNTTEQHSSVELTPSQLPFTQPLIPDSESLVALTKQQAIDTFLKELDNLEDDLMDAWAIEGGTGSPSTSPIPDTSKSTEGTTSPVVTRSRALSRSHSASILPISSSTSLAPHSTASLSPPPTSPTNHKPSSPKLFQKLTEKLTKHRKSASMATPASTTNERSVSPSNEQRRAKTLPSNAASVLAATSSSTL
jgi:WD40 repeat protein